MMESWPRVKESFSKSSFLLDIEEEHYLDILSSGDSIQLESGRTLFRQGDPAQRCYFVVSGRLKLIKLHEQGKEAIIRYIGPGEITAAVAVFRETDYPVTAKVIGTTEVFGWEKRTMTELMLKHPPLAINMLRFAINRIDELQTRFLEISAEQVEQRIAHALLRIMKQCGRKTDHGIAIDFRLSRQELADYTGTTLYTVSRTLSSWEKRGWIKSGREQITVAAPHALVLIANNT